MFIPKPENDKLSPSSKHKHMWLANLQNNHAGRVVVTPHCNDQSKAEPAAVAFCAFWRTYLFDIRHVIRFWHVYVCLLLADLLIPVNSCSALVAEYGCIAKPFHLSWLLIKVGKIRIVQKVRKVLRGTHTDFMRSPLYSIIRQGLKASLISPLLPLCTSQTHISWALRVTEDGWLSNLLRNSV